MTVLLSLASPKGLPRIALSLLTIFMLAAQPAAQAADALNGKSLYLNGPVSGGASCASCHGPSPANNVNGILAAANQPGVISAAIAQNLGGMGSLFNGKFSQAQLADLAAFIGNPTVSAAPAASLSPSSLTFSGTAIGQSAGPLGATLSNTGNAALNIGSISLGGAAVGDFRLAAGSCANGASLAPGASCTVQATFQPTAAGARAATLNITHNATGGLSSVSLAGTGNALPQATIALSAASIDFGSLLTGAASAPRSITVSNSGQAALTLSAIAVSGANASAFTLSGSASSGNCSITTPVAAGASCTLTVQATPAAAGALAASVRIDSNASNGSATVGLSAVAAAPSAALTASPSALAFGAQTIGAAAVTQNVTLTSTGNVAVNFSSIALPAAAGFSASNTCGASLAPGANCVVTVRFAPTVAGNASATLAVASNAAALQVGVSGSGTTAPVAVPALSETGPVAFADTQVGASSAAHTTTLSNSGNASLKVATLTLGGGQPGDFVLGGSCAVNTVLSSGASCTITSTFKPTAAGKRGADLQVVTDGGVQFMLALAGNGVAVVAAPALTVNPQTFDFGSVAIGATAPTRRFTLTNSGNAPLNLASAVFSGPYAAVADSTGCAAFPLVLQPGAACDLVVRYTPLNAGSNNGSVVLQATSPAASWTIALSGQATAAQVDVPPAAQPGAQPQNAGGGGCSAARDGNDPVLALLVALAFIVIGWRRHRARPGAHPGSRLDAGLGARSANGSGVAP